MYDHASSRGERGLIQYRIISNKDAILAVLTKKTGFAAAWAHDHLIVVDQQAASTEMTFSLRDPSDLESLSFTLTTRPDTLKVDLPEMQKKWTPRLVHYGLVSGFPFAFYLSTFFFLILAVFLFTRTISWDI